MTIDPNAPDPRYPYRVRRCPQCQRRRRMRSVGLPDAHRRWTCSQGHQWVEPLPTMERISAIQKAVFTPERLAALFDASPLCEALKGRR